MHFRTLVPALGALIVVASSGVAFADPAPPYSSLTLKSDNASARTHSTLTIKDKDVRLERSSPVARYAPVDGVLTALESANLNVAFAKVRDKNQLTASWFGVTIPLGGTHLELVSTIQRGIYKMDGYRVDMSKEAGALIDVLAGIEARLQQGGGAEKEIDATVFADASLVRLDQNRSNLFTVTNEPWIAILRSMKGTRVHAKIKITEPGMFGGKCEVLSVQGVDVRELKKVMVGVSAGKVRLEQNRSNIFTVMNEPFVSRLRALAGKQVDATIRITKAGMFGGECEVLELDSADEIRTVTGYASSGSIMVNRSAIWQVRNEPFKTLVKGLASDTRVTAKIRIVERGMFGGTCEVLSLDAHGARGKVAVHAKASLLSKTIERVASTENLTVVGVFDSKWLEVKTQSGKKGFVQKSALSFETTPGITGRIPGP